jgi:hypothetical protein
MCLTFIVLIWVAGTVVTRAADSAKSPNDAYLDALQGTWVMEGTLGGKSDVYIGFDAKANDYIAHWLDRFGAPGARVVARGERQATIHGRPLRATT